MAAAVVLTAVAVCSTTASASLPPSGPVTLPPSSVPVPTVTGPITGPGKPSIISTSFNLAKVGYQEDEYFIAGTASSYQMKGAPPANGRWKVTRRATARYKTRLLVYRPSDPKKFNGTVVVEWLNESAGSDTAPDWIGDHTELIRQGFAWVGVSAQALGINGGTGVLGGWEGPASGRRTRRGTGPCAIPVTPSLTTSSPRRPRPSVTRGAYRSWVGSSRKALIADGESQSAFFLTTYIDAIAPMAHVFNGYMVHSRWGGGTSLSGGLALGVHEPFRTDLGVPVFAFETETDLNEGYASNRQPDNRWFRDWEVAGTSHADDYLSLIGMSDNGRSNAAEAIVDQDNPLTIIGCTALPNSGPQHFVLDAAIFELNRWVRIGTPPPHAPRIQLTSGPDPTIRRDSLGNALGGIRTPELDVPISTLTGTAAPGQSETCSLFGSTTPFSTATLTSLYPTHADYVAKFDAATGRAVKAGFILAADARQIEAAAAASDVP
jgi:hypothetical protein